MPSFNDTHAHFVVCGDHAWGAAAVTDPRMTDADVRAEDDPALPVVGGGRMAALVAGLVAGLVAVIRLGDGAPRGQVRARLATVAINSRASTGLARWV